jgi:uncharacterized membrane protein YfcA
MLILLLAIVGLAVLVYAGALARAAFARGARPSPEALLLGAVANFFDTLGIGSFATTTAWLKFRRLVPDRLIPPTLLTGLTPPAMVQSLVFLILLGVQVDPLLLGGAALATMVGGIVGVPLVVKARAWIVQLTVAIGLTLAAAAYAMASLDLFPAGGTASGLPPLLTAVAIVASFGMGILANFGVGNYAPSLVMFSLMGMDPRLCFPIMATGGSLMGAAASVKHFAVGEVNLKIVLGLAIGGIPAVLVAALLVKNMPIDVLRLLVLVVVLYAAAVMFRAAALGRRAERADGAEERAAT